MNKSEVIAYFGTNQAVANVLEGAHSTVSTWPEQLPTLVADRVRGAFMRLGIRIPDSWLDLEPVQEFPLWGEESVIENTRFAIVGVLHRRGPMTAGEVCKAMKSAIPQWAIYDELMRMQFVTHQVTSSGEGVSKVWKLKPATTTS